MEWMGSNNDAVAFLRVSAGKQKDNSSHVTQEREIIQYCTDNGLALLEVFKMVESAKDSNLRVHYKRGLESALRTGVRHILFYIFDRETRNLTDNERNENLVKAGKIVIHYVKESKVYHKDSSDSDFFLRDVQAVTNKQFIRQLRTKILDAMQTKAESGWYPSNNIPWGYRTKPMVGPDGTELRRGRIVVPDPNERRRNLVIREFELRAQGYSYDQIRKTIVAEGHITAGAVRGYSKASVENRIKNPFYRGSFKWRGQIYKGKHELIIPPKILAKVDASIEGKQYQRKTEGDHGLFGGGWISCNECGCNVVYDPKVKGARTHHYYHCTNGKRLHPSLRGMNAREEDMWVQFGHAVGSISISEKMAALIAKALNESHIKLQRSKERELGLYRDGLAALEHDEDLAYQDFRKGILSEDMYRRQVTRIRDERRRFTDLLEQSNKAMDGSYLETAQSILELSTNAKSLWLSRNSKERLEFLKRILSNPKLDGLTVRYELRKPYAQLHAMSANSDWCTRLDEFRTALISIAA